MSVVLWQHKRIKSVETHYCSAESKTLSAEPISVILQAGNKPCPLCPGGPNGVDTIGAPYMSVRPVIIAALFIATGMVSVQAADIAVRPYVKAAAAVDPAYNWTGFYIGGHAGYSWMDSTDTLSPANAFADGFFTPPPIIAASLPLDPKGFIVGGQAGYNWKVSPIWVIGVEADLSWLNLDKTVSLPAPG